MVGWLRRRRPGAPTSWVENYSANITYTYTCTRGYIARRCTALGGADDLELLALGKSWAHREIISCIYGVSDSVRSWSEEREGVPCIIICRLSR